METWDDAWKLMEPHDDHKPVPVGGDGYIDEDVSDDGLDDDEDDDDGDDDDDDAGGATVGWQAEAMMSMELLNRRHQNHR